MINSLFEVVFDSIKNYTKIKKQIANTNKKTIATERIWYN